MALLGTMSLFPPVAAPNQPVDCLLNIVNNGATALTVNGIRGLVADAAMKGDKTAVRALIAQKADVNAAQADGATAHSRSRKN